MYVLKSREHLQNNTREEHNMFFRYVSLYKTVVQSQSYPVHVVNLHNDQLL